jgi:hypothetical protein
MSINNREDLNKYYDIINELVDEYIDKWKIRPSRLKKYLKPGTKRFQNFLNRNNLSEVNGSDRILRDIIDDRTSMEKDGILTFESYKLFESDNFEIKSLEECLYKGVEKADLKMEKVLADYFDTNLSSISIDNSEKHIFKVDTWSSEKKVIIYSKEEIDLIKENIFEHLYKELSNRNVDLVDGVSIGLNDLIGEDKFENKLESIFTKDFTIKMVSKLLNYKFESEKSDHFIWVENM